MNPEDFEDSSPGRLVSIGHHEKPCFAFVPNPLPPTLQLDTKIFNGMSEAALALGELAGLGRSMANPNLLISPFIRREAVLSSRIEGTQTNIANLYAYESEQLTFFERHREDYYDLMLAVSQRGAWQDWLLFFLRGVKEQSQDAVIRSKKLQDLQE